MKPVVQLSTQPPRRWLAALCLGLSGASGMEPSAEQEAYWWQDEVRRVAWSLSAARIGKIAQWPRMKAPSGSATLPLPLVNGPVVADAGPGDPYQFRGSIAAVAACKAGTL